VEGRRLRRRQVANRFVGLEKNLFRDGGVRGELGAETPLQLLAHVGDFHAGHHDEFAGEHFARLVIIGELASYAAILAILIPAEAPVRNSFRADELKAAQQGIAFRDLEFSTEDIDVHKLFVRTKRFRHDLV
jgi:hypothetical protein